MQAIAERITRAVRVDRLSDAIRKVRELKKIREVSLAEVAAEMAVGLKGSFTALVSPNDKKFRSQHPELRQAISSLCKSRLSEAARSCKLILDQARKRYESAGYGQEEIESDLLVRNARRKVSVLKARLESINDPTETDMWHHAEALLNDK